MKEKFNFDIEHEGLNKLSKSEIGNRILLKDGRFTLPKEISWKTIVTFIYIPIITVAFNVEQGILMFEKNYLVLFSIFTFIHVLSIYLIIQNFMDNPGIIPQELNDIQKSEIKTEEINGKEFALRICTTCNIYRPLRAHHCNSCGVCVEELDHHCEWISNCIGKRNRLYFFLMIFFVCITSLIIFAYTSIRIISENMENLNRLLIYFYLITSLIASLLSMLLLIFHIYLMGANLTTVEFIRHHYDECGNPFDMGILKNTVYFWTTKRKINTIYDSKKNSLDEESYSKSIKTSKSSH